MEEEVSREVKEPKGFERLCLLVLDGSGSMQDPNPQASMSKADTINQCVKDLIIGLQQHKYSADLLLGIITFDDTVDRNPAFPITPVEEIDINNCKFDPMNDLNGVGRGGQTAIGDALEITYQTALDFIQDPNKQYPRSAVLLLMTDGVNTAGKDPEQVSIDIHNEIKAKELKGRLRRVCCLGLGDPNDKESLDADLLKRIVTQPAEGPKPNYAQTLDPEAIVDFFTRSFVNDLGK